MNELSVIKSQDLTLLVESNLITPEAQKSLALAAAAIPAMLTASTAVGERRFAQADSILSVRGNNPVDQARDTLASIDRLWSGAGAEFHRLRTAAYAIKVQKAKLKATQNKIAAITDADDREVAMAEAELISAEIDGATSALANGQDKLQRAVTSAAAHAERYQKLCLTAGVVNFTADDFLKDEIAYLIKTAFWHAGQGFRTIDTRDKYSRGPSAEETAARKAGKHRLADHIKTVKQREGMDVRVDLSTGTWFEALGISKDEVKSELAWVEGQKHAHGVAQSHGEKTDFFPLFESWLTQMVKKYTDRVLDQVKRQGPDRLRRLQGIVKEGDDRGQGGGGAEFERGSMFDG